MKVKRTNIGFEIRMDTVDENEFPSLIAEAMRDLISRAKASGAGTVDWSTLRIEPGETVFAIDMSGERFAYGQSLTMTAEAVMIA